MAGPAELQASTVAEGSRALRLSDDSTAERSTYVISIPDLTTNFQVDYYLRAERYEQVVGLIVGDLSVTRIGGLRTHIRAELSELNRAFWVQGTPYFNFELGRRYHVRLVVRYSLQSFDVYVDNMEVPLATNMRFSNPSFNVIGITTATAGIGSGYWDGLL